MTSTSNLPSNSFNFTVKWKAENQLVDDHDTEWPDAVLTVDHLATIKMLLDKIKNHIQNNLETHYNVAEKGIKPFMRALTDNGNHVKIKSKQDKKSTFWVIRFQTTLTSDEGSHNLDSGVWSRVRTITDLVKDPAQLKAKDNIELTVHVGAEADKRIENFRTDTDLTRFVYPVRQVVEYFKVGSTQKHNHEKFLLRDTELGEKPVERKNVILAQFEEINDNRMSNDFRVIGSWRFRDSPSKWFRIGDPDGGKLFTLADIATNLTKLSKPYQENGQNVDLTELKKRVLDHKTKKGERAWKKQVPKLPKLTFNPFDKAQLADATNMMGKDSAGKDVFARIVIRMVYSASDLGLSADAQRTPRDLGYQFNDENTLASLERDIFEEWDDDNPDDPLPAGITEDNHSRVWWIMVSDQNSEIGKMYRVEDPDTLIVRYVRNAASREASKEKPILVYAELHVRSKDADEQYTADGK